ncbi:Rab geranylgeranyltransferase [Meyerozyma guilliermondii]
MQHGVKRISLSEQARKEKIQRDKSKIANYRALCKDLLDKKDKDVRDIATLQATTDLLLKNPEFYTIWNYRRDIIVALVDAEKIKKKDTLEDDLKLIVALLKRYPKCYWIWNHRIWCLDQLQQTREANWNVELAIVSKFLDLDSRNYHCWQYRRFVINNMEEDTLLESSESSNSGQKEARALLRINIEEYKFTTSKINKNISNFSAWHNRTKLIPKIYDLFGELDTTNDHADVRHVFARPQTILQHELELVKTGMFMDSDDTSIWLYLQWLLTNPFFVDDLRKVSPTCYLDVLNAQLAIVEELNELEREDHPKGWDHRWCLRCILLIKSLIREETSEIGALDDMSRKMLQSLTEIDPLRKCRYLDQLEGTGTSSSLAF